MSTYRSPNINGMTVLIVAGWLVVNLALFLATASSNAPSGAETGTPLSETSTLLPNTASRNWMAGTTLGLVASISWLATSIGNSFTRFSVRILAAMSCVLLLTFFSTPDLIRHAVSVSGLILVQSLVFFALAIPDWAISLSFLAEASRLDQKTEASQQPKSPQFHVGELITLTTLVALLLAASRQYTPPVNSLVYWPVLIFSWLLLQTIAALTIRVVMFRQIQILMFLVPLIFLTIVGLANAEEFASDAPEQAAVYLRLYSFIIAGFTCSIAVLCLSGGSSPAQTLADSKNAPANTLE